MPSPLPYNVLGDPVLDGIGNAYDPEQGNHIDAHISFFVNGQQYGSPMGIGIDYAGVSGAIINCTYGPETGNPFIATGTTFYWLHTHDHAGIVHVEHQTGPAQGLPLQPFTLGQFFQVWGQPLSTTGAAGFSGLVRVFLYNDDTAPGTPPVEWTGDPNAAPFGMNEHDEVAIEIGAPWVSLPLYSWDPTWDHSGPGTCVNPPPYS
jgi:hypothetical protein